MADPSPSKHEYTVPILRDLEPHTEFWSRRTLPGDLHGLRNWYLHPGAVYFVTGPAPVRRALLARFAAWALGFSCHVTYGSFTELPHDAGRRVLTSYHHVAVSITSSSPRVRETIENAVRGTHLHVAGLGNDCLLDDLSEQLRGYHPADVVVLDQPFDELALSLEPESGLTVPAVLCRAAVRLGATVVVGDTELTVEEQAAWRRYSDDIFTIEQKQGEWTVASSVDTDCAARVQFALDNYLVELLDEAPDDHDDPTNHIGRERFIVSTRVMRECDREQIP